MAEYLNHTLLLDIEPLEEGFDRMRPTVQSAGKNIEILPDSRKTTAPHFIPEAPTDVKGLRRADGETSSDRLAQQDQRGREATGSDQHQDPFNYVEIWSPESS